MPLDLPIVQEGPHFRFVTELDGVAYSFEFRWNDREEAWFVTVGDGEGTPIAASVRVVVNWPLLARFADPRLPTGVLLALDTEARDREAGYEDLGRRVLVTYFSAAELAAA